MDPEVTDNHVIRSAQVYLEKHPESSPAIVTEDTGMVLRARNAGVRAFRLPDSERLPNADDELTRRARKAEAELAEERNRRPNLAIVAKPVNAAAGAFDWDSPFSPGDFQLANVAEEMQRCRARQPKTATRGTGPFALPVLRLPGSDEYEKNLVDYYAKYERWLNDRNDWLRKRGSFFSFELLLTNTGKAMATIIRVEITFPSLVLLLNNDVLFDPSDKYPLPPHAPKEPSFDSILGGSPLVSVETQASTLARSLREPKKPQVSYAAEEGGARLRINLAELIHESTTRLHTLTLWFPVKQQPQKFGAQYSLISAELPKSVQEHVLFEIQ
jgi:hypothetical protein